MWKFYNTCKTCGGTSTPIDESGAAGTGLGGAAVGLCCCKFWRNSASRLSCSCSCSRISWSFSCVRDVGVAVLNVGGLKTIKNESILCIKFYLPSPGRYTNRSLVERDWRIVVRKSYLFVYFKYRSIGN